MLQCDEDGEDCCGAGTLCSVPAAECDCSIEIPGQEDELSHHSQGNENGIFCVQNCPMSKILNFDEI